VSIPFSVTPDSVAHIAFPITKSDTDLAAPIRALYVGSSGNVKIKDGVGGTVTFVNVASGSILPVMCTCVFSTDTTAGNFVGLI
jgi:hypothetical protein